MSSKSKAGKGRGGSRGKALGALAVAGIVSAATPSLARAEETSASAARGSSSMFVLARMLIAELLEHRGAFATMASVGAASMASLQPTHGSVPTPQANTPDCGCSRAGNGKGPPKRIDCEGAEAVAARASGELSTTCAPR